MSGPAETPRSVESAYSRHLRVIIIASEASPKRLLGHLFFFFLLLFGLTLGQAPPAQSIGFGLGGSLLLSRAASASSVRARPWPLQKKKRRARYLHSGPVVGRPGRLTAYMGGVCDKGPLMTGGCAGAGSGAGIRL